MKKIILFFLSAIISTSYITTTFANSYSVYSSYSKNEETGISDGKFRGIVDGYETGYENYLDDNKDYTYKKTITNELNYYLDSKALKNESDDYVEGFENGYENGYKKGYDIGIKGEIITYDKLLEIVTDDDTTIDTISDNSDGAYYGKSQGTNFGDYNANIDFNLGKSLDAQRSLSSFENEKSLTSRFYLNKVDSTYKNDFILSFRENYIKAYNETYLSLLNGFSSENEEFIEIDDTGVVTITNPKNYEKNITFSFPTASLNGDNYISISTDLNPVTYPDNYIYTSNSFKIDTLSTKNFSNYNYINPIKDFTMTINFDFDSDDVGIYEYKNGSWQYLYTNITKDAISHTFPSGQYIGGKYCIFKQPTYKTFNDISFSPFSEEIYTYARRGAIYGYDKFYPTANITRGELAYIINGILNPNNIYVEPSKIFTDVNNTSPFYNATNFVTSNNYINGISDTEFGLNNGITYNQMKIIIERITGEIYDIDKTFDDMINNKFHRSNGIDDLNSYVTKEEAVYMIYSVLR